MAPEHTSPDGNERAERLAGERALEAADHALEADDARAARASYLLAARHFRRAAECAAVTGDEGARRALEAAAVDALYAALPISG